MNILIVINIFILLVGCSSSSKQISDHNKSTPNINYENNDDYQKSTNAPSKIDYKNSTDSNLKDTKSCSLIINKISNQLLCNHYASKAYPECNSDILSELISKNLYSYSTDSCKLNKYIEPPVIIKKCSTFIHNLILQSDPISKACILRYKPNDSDSILCRKDLNNFITSNSKGIGSSSKNCGIE